MNNSERTLYPKIYDGTYWNNFKSNDDKTEIYNNRNRLVEEHNIIKYITFPPRYILKETHNNTMYDHVEHYRTDDRKYVVISSPYTPNTDDFYELNGWQKIGKLYANNATTYMKIIPMK